MVERSTPDRTVRGSSPLTFSFLLFMTCVFMVFSSIIFKHNLWWLNGSKIPLTCLLDDCKATRRYLSLKFFALVSKLLVGRPKKKR